MESGAGDENAVPTKEEEHDEQVQVPNCCFLCFSHALGDITQRWHDLFHLHLFAGCIISYASILYDYP